MRKICVEKWLYFYMVLLATLELCYSVQCEFCQKDFKSLGRHVWRCKAKLSSIQQTSHVTIETHSNIEIETVERTLAKANNNIPSNNDPPDIRIAENKDTYKCCCGKVCNGLKGLQAHKRSCKVIDIPDIKSLFEYPIVNNEEELDDRTENLQFDKIETIPGIKLPSTKEEWELANNYFKAELPWHQQNHIYNK